MDKTLLTIYATNGSYKPESQIRMLPNSVKHSYIKTLINQGYQLSPYEKELMKNDEGLMLTNYTHQAKHCIDEQYCFLGITGFQKIPYELKLPYIKNLFLSASYPSAQFLSELSKEDIYKYLDFLTHVEDDGKRTFVLNDNIIQNGIREFLDISNPRDTYNHYNKKLENKEILNNKEINLLVPTQLKIYNSYI